MGHGGRFQVREVKEGKGDGGSSTLIVSRFE
jgi:hypothetical protein